MDPQLKTLLIELARTTLRVLEPTSASVGNTTQPTPWLTTTNQPAERIVPINTLPALLERLDKAVPAPPKRVERGGKVRVWSGDRYEFGTVEAIGRDKVTCKVRITRGEGRRDKIVSAHIEKLVCV